MVKLRDYQEEAVKKVINFLKNKKGNPLVVAPTGSGKSLMIASICTRLREKPSKKIMVLAHRKELLEQNAEAIKLLNTNSKIDLYSNSMGLKSLNADILIGGIASIARVPQHKLPKIDYIIIDEAHLVNTKNQGIYRALIGHYPDARVIGLSATPFRLDGGLLHRNATGIFTDIVVNLPIVRLMEEGYLAALRSKESIVDVDLSNVRVKHGDFIVSEYEEKYNNVSLIEQSVNDMMANAKDRHSWLVFCCSVKHAKEVSEEINKRGRICKVITGETSLIEREDIIRKFKNKEIDAITNCDVLTVGFDAPNVDMIAILRPTKSCGLFMQICGRGTRLYPTKKDCMILDYGKNLQRFGPIDLINFEEDSFGKLQIKAAQYKTCPECREVIPANAIQCIICEFKFEVQHIEREVKHEVIASDIEVLSYESMFQQHDKKKSRLITIHCHVNKDKYGSAVLMLTYKLEKLGLVCENYRFGGTGKAKKKSLEFWQYHVKDVPYPIDVEEFMSLENKLTDIIRFPSLLAIARHEGINYIVQRYWEAE